MTGLRAADVKVGDYSIRVNETGDPSLPAVLWLHGSGPGVSALSNWERLITQLMPGFRNVAPDILGFGESSHPEDPPRGMTAYTELRAEVTAGLLDALDLDRVHVVGNSMGGMITLRMLQKYPGRFGRAVLMGSGGAPEPPTPDLVKMVRFYEDPTPAAMRKLMDNFIFDTSAFGGDLDAIAEDRGRKALRARGEALAPGHLRPIRPAARLPARAAGRHHARDPGDARARGPDAAGAELLLPRQAPAQRPAARAPARRALDAARAGRALRRSGGDLLPGKAVSPDLTGSGYDRRPASSLDELVRVGRGTPYGEVLRRYWHPVALAADATTAPADPDPRRGPDPVPDEVGPPRAPRPGLRAPRGLAVLRRGRGGGHPLLLSRLGVRHRGPLPGTALRA